MDERIANETRGEYLTGRQAAALLPGVSYATFMRWARQGAIPSTQYVSGGRRVFRRGDIEAMLSPRTDGASVPVEPGQQELSW
nr:helix-turn-helix domain-containing protein [Actinomyces sp.]